MSKAQLFVKYLEEIGVVAPIDANALLDQLNETQEDKKITFELTNYIQLLNTSAMFDLSSRLYQYWLRSSYIPMLTSQLENANLTLQNKNYETREKIAAKSHSKLHKPLTGGPIASRKPNNNITRNNYKNSLEKRIKRKSTSPKTMTDKTSKKHPYESIHSPQKNEERCLTAPGTNEIDENIDPDMSLDGQIKSKTKIQAHGVSSSNLRNNEDYEQRVPNEKNYIVRNDPSDLRDLKELKFSPQVNPLKSNSQTLVNHLQIPVFQRLSSPKSHKKDRSHLSHDHREMMGVTFQPDLSRTHRPPNSARDKSPGHQKLQASERLYHDAQLKRETLALKKECLKNQELADCTFRPQLVSSPPSSKEYTRKNSDTTERLYQDSVRRQLKEKAIEKTKENENFECTFHPQRLTQNYDQRLKNSNQDLGKDVFTKLYQSARKKQELEKELEEEMVVLDSKRSCGSSNTNDLSLCFSFKLLRESLDKNFTINEVLNENSNAPSRKNSGLEPFSRLYDERNLRIQKLSQLEQKVFKERGITFTPLTNRSQSSFQLSGTKSQKNSSLFSLNTDEKLLPEGQHNRMRSLDSEFFKKTREKYHSQLLRNNKKSNIVKYQFDEC